MPAAVCCLDEPGAWAQRLVDRGIVVTALGRAPGFHPLLGRKVAAAARMHGATVVHAHQYSPFVYSALARPWQPALAVVFTEHGRLSDAPPSTKRRLANQAIGGLADRVYAVSEDVKRHLVAEGFRADRVGVIYNGVEVGAPAAADVRHDVRASLGVSHDTLIIGTIARLDPVKDLATLLHASAAVARARPLRLVIVGDGPERSALERLAAELDVARWTVFLGKRDDARRWLEGCDIYVNSSVSEGVSLTILEAMAAALPIVATRVGGTPEIIDETCGRLVPARDPHALGAALLELAGDAAHRASIGRAARDRVARRFTIERMVDEYRAVYETVGSASASGRS
ncbi:MAG: glycosyltransferase [Acidobacteria bacterium]|nr:glycosyltransferase [Acidobacteriota bacterium]